MFFAIAHIALIMPGTLGQGTGVLPPSIYKYSLSAIEPKRFEAAKKRQEKRQTDSYSSNRKYTYLINYETFYLIWIFQNFL